MELRAPRLRNLPVGARHAVVGTVVDPHALFPRCALFHEVVSPRHECEEWIDPEGLQHVVLTHKFHVIDLPAKALMEPFPRGSTGLNMGSEKLLWFLGGLVGTGMALSTVPNSLEFCFLFLLVTEGVASQCEMAIQKRGKEGDHSVSHA